MRDIGVLKDRIINLETYVSLSLLEKAALDLTILDENGLDRFKNGIFVDTFENHILGATYNPDYRIVVDPREKSIRPVYTTNSNTGQIQIKWARNPRMTQKKVEVWKFLLDLNFKIDGSS